MMVAWSLWCQKDINLSGSVDHNFHDTDNFACCHGTPNWKYKDHSNKLNTFFYPHMMMMSASLKEMFSKGVAQAIINRQKGT